MEISINRQCHFEKFKLFPQMKSVNMGMSNNSVQTSSGENSPRNEESAPVLIMLMKLI